MKLFSNNKSYIEFQFDKEYDFEREIISNSKLFFGANSIFIDAKKKIESKNIGKIIPDGFLFDLSDMNSPEFYLVEVELSKHDFFNHIFPQITKFFGFFKNSKSQNDLIEKIFSIITNDVNLKKEFKKYLGEKEVYKFLKDTIENSQNILLVIDGEKKEMPEIIETYSDTWGKLVKHILINKFTNSEGIIYTMDPEFENIEFSEIENISHDESENVEYNEEYHLESVSDKIRNVYFNIRDSLKRFDGSIIFNPQKYYISLRKERNVAFFLIKRKKIKIVVLLSDEETKTLIHFHTVITLSKGVQKFYNGPSCAIVIEDYENLDEVIELLKKLIAK